MLQILKQKVDNRFIMCYYIRVKQRYKTERGIYYDNYRQ